MTDIVAVDSGKFDDVQFEQHEVVDLIDSIRRTATPETSVHGASVFDSSAMSPLSPTAVRALARLRAYTPPPFPIWNKLPVSRRAAVLLLLFADRRGDLRVVVTMRASTLRNYSGQAALPGGKADSLTESPVQISRREAYEEIGLPMDDSKITSPFRIEHICQLPLNLAKTELAVRPCVAFLHSDDDRASVEEKMIPRLDAKEVAAVFSAPFHNFLRAEDEIKEGEKPPGKPSDWYSGSWTEWHEGRWRMHHFYVPINNQIVSKPRVRDGGQKAIAEQLEEEDDADLIRYKVWGMTARILVDAARLAYDEEPTFEHNAHFGDESIIEKLYEIGRLQDKKVPGSELTKDDLLNAASKM